jgi:hypothetical protein
MASASIFTRRSRAVNVARVRARGGGRSDGIDHGSINVGGGGPGCLTRKQQAGCLAGCYRNTSLLDTQRHTASLHLSNGLFKFPGTAFYT